MLEEIAVSAVIITVIILALTSCSCNREHPCDEPPIRAEPTSEYPK